MYHGTYKELKLVKPNFSRLVGGPAVYGTPHKRWAVLFSADWNDDDLDVGVHNGVAYIREMYAGAFSRLKKSGYVCQLSDDTFENDSRLGLKGIEFISRTACRAESCEFIESIWEWLVADGVFSMLPYA